MLYICTRKSQGAIAQLVEQRTENPCVPGSIPGGTTLQNANNLKIKLLAFFLFLFLSNICPTKKARKWRIALNDSHLQV